MLERLREAPKVFASRLPVRSLDAVHFASALLLRHWVPELVIVSTDERVRENARQLGFDIFPPP